MDEILHSGIRPTMQDVARGRVLQGRGMRLPGYRGRSEVVRFLEKVDTAPGGCWRWRGRIHDNGYTYYRGGDGVWHGHRMAYKLFVGPLDPAMEIDHLCRNKSCVNPDHLEQVPASTNLKRAKPWATCDRLHPGTSTRIAERADGRRFCRECQRSREAQRRAKVAGARASKK